MLENGLNDSTSSNDHSLQELEQLPDAQSAELLAEFERRRRARQIHVSTDDTEVRANLRQLSEPICLFGEGPPERRERLRSIVSRLSDDEIAKKLRKKEEQEKREEESQNEITWYHEGSENMRIARIWTAQYSLLKAKERIATQKAYSQIPEIERNAKIQESHRYIRNFSNYCSQVGDTRPLSFCRFSPNSKMIAISSW